MSSDRKMPDDRELEDFLAGLHPAGKAYREASKDEGAPPELDAAILGAAREAVRTRQRALRRPRWVQPVAVAATLALSLGVLLNLWRDPQTRQQMAPTVADPDLQRAKEQSLEQGADAALSARKAEAAPAAAGASHEQAPPAELGAAAGAMLEGELDGKANDSRSIRLPIEEQEKKSKAYARKESEPLVAPAEPAKPEPPKLESRPETAKSAAEARPESSIRSSGGFVPEPPPSAQVAPAPAAAPPPPPPSAPAPQMAAQPQSNSVAPAARAGAAGPGDGRRLEDAPAKAAKDEREQSREKLDAMAKQRSGDADDAATGCMAPPSSRAAPMTTPPGEAVEQESGENADFAEDSFVIAPPDVWIRRICDLRDRGDDKGARDLLKSFRSRYPDYVLPEDLRALVRSPSP